jgi:hypothetical protein
MVRGLDIFADYFSSFTDCYALIGGSACFLLLSDAGLEFRATKDLDIVLCMEEFSDEFGQALWDFIENGKYTNYQSSAGVSHFYRFLKPKNTDYPHSLELFSRIPDALELHGDPRYTPIPVDDDIASLSAILMDDDYYRLVVDGKTIVGNTSIVKAEHLIPLKIKAWIELTDRKNSGIRVDSSDIRKHRNDLFRLYQIISPESSISLPEAVSQDMIEGMNRLRLEHSLDLSSWGLRNTNVDEVLNIIEKIYNLR